MAQRPCGRPNSACEPRPRAADILPHSAVRCAACQGTSWRATLGGVRHGSCSAAGRPPRSCSGLGASPFGTGRAAAVSAPPVRRPRGWTAAQPTTAVAARRRQRCSPCSAAVIRFTRPGMWNRRSPQNHGAPPPGSGPNAKRPSRTRPIYCIPVTSIIAGSMPDFLTNIHNVFVCGHDIDKLLEVEQTQ